MCYETNMAHLTKTWLSVKYNAELLWDLTLIYYNFIYDSNVLLFHM